MSPVHTEEKAKNTMTMWERLLRVYTDTKAFMQTKSWLAIAGMPHKSTNIIHTTLKQYIHNFSPMNYSVSKKWWSQASKQIIIKNINTSCTFSQSSTSCTFSQSSTSCTFSQSINIKYHARFSSHVEWPYKHKHAQLQDYITNSSSKVKQLFETLYNCL